MSLLLALFSVTATCAPNPSLAGSAAERVRAYIDAINARDEPAIGRFLKSGATFAAPGVAPLALEEVMTRLVATPEAELLEVTEATARGESVILRTRAARSGATASATVQLEGGCVSRFVQG